MGNSLYGSINILDVVFFGAGMGVDLADKCYRLAVGLISRRIGFLRLDRKGMDLLRCALGVMDQQLQLPGHSGNRLIEVPDLILGTDNA
ncbi:hypothetical protein D3C75_751130 [compost metagenome]